MENSVGTFRTDRLMQGDRPSQVTVNTGSTVQAIKKNLNTKKKFAHLAMMAVMFGLQIPARVMYLDT